MVLVNLECEKNSHEKLHTQLANYYFRHFPKVRINNFTHCAPVKMSLKHRPKTSAARQLLLLSIIDLAFK